MCNCKVALKGSQSRRRSGTRGHSSGEKILLLTWRFATRRKGCRQLWEGAGETAVVEGTSYEPPCPPANSRSVVAAAFSSSDGLTFTFKGAEVIYFLLFMVPRKLET